jgi:hypothetical protein
VNEPLFVKVNTVHRAPAASAYSETKPPVTCKGAGLPMVSANVFVSVPFAFVAVILIFASPAASG